MLNFVCDSCGQQIFFENTRCVRCNYNVAFLPGTAELRAIESAGEPAGSEGSLYRAFEETDASRIFRRCENWSKYDACNWLVPADSPNDRCESCLLTDAVPDLSCTEQRGQWVQIEAAKRRLLYNLKRLSLPIEGRAARPDSGLSFRFLKGTREKPVITGHSQGVITLNVSEANSAFRENARQKLGEAYRTVLGHLRHEIGHYYWDRLVASSDNLAPFRALFGEETASYEEAIARHYEDGPPIGWPTTYVSAYATMHPWEDFAETWAHYLHIVDTMETAHAFNLSVSAPAASATRARTSIPDPIRSDFESLFNAWYSLTFALNGLSRSMGARDLYPFVIAEPVRHKLRFVHQLCRKAAKLKGPPSQSTGTTEAIRHTSL